jgi:23S rRNA (pseudouridine1915-N3)-methyltransferase
MSRLRLIWVGKTQRGFIQEGVEHYLKRVRSLLPAECEEVRAADHSGRGAAQALKLEAQALLKRIGPADTVIVLDERGTHLATPQLAERLARLQAQRGKDLCFVVGGAYGLAPQLPARAQLVLSLSKLTFPHQLARVILLEQLYRALSLNAGLPYHHGDP